MSTKSNKSYSPRRKSKRAKRQKLVIYIMIFAMVLSSITMGLAYFLAF